MGISEWVQIGLLISSSALAYFTWRLYTTTAGLAEKTNVVATKTQELADQTSKVATRTHELADDTVAANKLADQHHQESLVPCVRFKGQVWATASAQAGYLNANLVGKLVNVGLGIAKTCEISIGIGEPLKAGPVGKDEEVTVNYVVQFGSSRQPHEWVWKLIISYQNFAGETGTTEHFGKGSEPSVYTTIYTPPQIAKRV